MNVVQKKFLGLTCIRGVTTGPSGEMRDTRLGLNQCCDVAKQQVAQGLQAGARRKRKVVTSGPNTFYATHFFCNFNTPIPLSLYSVLTLEHIPLALCNAIVLKNLRCLNKLYKSCYA